MNDHPFSDESSDEQERDDESTVVRDDELFVDAPFEPAFSGLGSERVARKVPPLDRVNTGESRNQRNTGARYGNTEPVGLSHPDFRVRASVPDQRRGQAYPDANPAESRHGYDRGWKSRDAEDTGSRRANPPVVDRRPVSRRDIIREGDVLLGKYRVERVAIDSLVTTAEAVHLELGSRAAVLLLSTLDGEFAQARDHFIRSTRTLSRMQSKHFARILDAGVLESGAPFMVTQLVGMTNLAGLMREQGPLTVTDTVDFVIQISEALAEGHSHGIFHGSLKPSNVRLATGIDGLPIASLMGFGVMAQWTMGAVNASTRRTGAVSWPPSGVPYMSPEQIRRPMDLDFRTDLWSLGTIMHEALVGEPLYQADTDAALLASIVADPPTPISAIRGDIPRQLEFVVLRCLEKDPAARYPSLAEFVRALQPFASSESRGIIDRIVRVLARHGGASELAPRSPFALVHSPRRGPSEEASSDAPPTPPKQQAEASPSRRAPMVSPLRSGAIVAILVGVGLSAGVVGALVTARVLGSRSVDETSESASQASPAQPQIFAATPSALSTTSALPSDATHSNPSTPAVSAKHGRSPVNRAEGGPSTSKLGQNKNVTATNNPTSKEEGSDPQSTSASHRPITAANQLFDDIK